MDSGCPCVKGKIPFVNNSGWTDAADAVTCLLPMSAHNNRILHIDGDSFFASCEIALDPKLEGRPVWVGGGRRGDGIVIAANRSAKKFGIKTGIFPSALRRIPGP